MVRAIVKRPFHVKDTSVLGGEILKQGFSQIEPAEGTAGAFILDGGDGALAAVRDFDLFSAPFVGRVLVLVQGDDEVSARVSVSACAEPSFVEGCTPREGIAASFLERVLLPSFGKGQC